METSEWRKKLGFLLFKPETGLSLLHCKHCLFSTLNKWTLIYSRKNCCFKDTDTILKECLVRTGQMRVYTILQIWNEINPTKYSYCLKEKDKLCFWSGNAFPLWDTVEVQKLNRFILILPFSANRTLFVCVLLYTVCNSKGYALHY